METKNQFDRNYFSGAMKNYKGGYNLDGIREKYFSDKILYLKEEIGGSQNVKVLDIGCAFGYFLKICDRQDWQTFGIDISGYAIERAKNETKAGLSVLDINRDKLPFADKYFDIITAFDIVEHLADQDNFYSEIERAIKPGGIVIIESAYGRSKIDHDETHINIKDDTEISKILNTRGFEVIKIEKGRHYPVRIIPLRRFRPMNLLNQKICNLFGLFLLPLSIVAKKNKII